LNTLPSTDEPDAVANVRNICIIAHVDHGKTTLSDTLLQRGGLLNKKKIGAGHGNGGCKLDTNKQEQDRGITIYSTVISIDFNLGSSKAPLRVNLIDSPGHVDFNSEVTAALRVTDGALVVVDAVEGVMPQTRTVLRQALADRVRPVLMLNKVDRLIIEQQKNAKEIYAQFCNTIRDINDIIRDAFVGQDEEDMPLVSIANDTVCFGSGYFGWAASVRTFATMYQQHSAVASSGSKQPSLQQLCKHLAKPKQFCRQVLRPIVAMHRLCVQDLDCGVITKAKQAQICKKLLSAGRKAPSDAVWLLPARKALRHIMSAFLPAGDALVDLIQNHLPNPRSVHAHRFPCMLPRVAASDDDEDDDELEQKDCPLTNPHAALLKHQSTWSPNGDCLAYVCKMVPVPGSKQFMAVARVYRGQVRSGQQLYVLPPNYNPLDKGSSSKPVSVRVQRVGRPMADKVVRQDVACAGDIVGLFGLGNAIPKTGTLSSSLDAVPLLDLNFVVAPVVRMAIAVSNPRMRQPLREAMSRLQKTDPCALCFVDPETKQNIIAGVGELHLDVCKRALEEAISTSSKVTLKCSEPMVSYRESVAAAGPECLAKSSNKLNRILVRAKPLSAGLVADLEAGTIGPSTEPKALRALLRDKYGWSDTLARKVWAFGPEIGVNEAGGCTNILVNATTGVQNILDIRQSVCSAFQQFCAKGVLVEQALRGVCFEVVDAKIHRDAPHRGAAQVCPMARRALSAAFLSAQPTIVEPIYAVQVSLPNRMLKKAFPILAGRGAQITEVKPGVIAADLCIRKSFKLVAELQGATSGEAFTQLQFGGWQRVPGELYVDTSETHAVVTNMRVAKKLKTKLPIADDYQDRL